MTSLELRVPPDVVALVVAGLMWLVSRFVVAPVAWSPLARTVLALILVSAGVALILAARVRFARHRTTFAPLRPSRASTLVTDGVYRFSRNPMYLGTWLILLGLAAALGSVSAALVSLVFAFSIARFQIVPEERALAARFGGAYESYCRKVRRWI